MVEVDEPNAVGASVNSNGCPGTGEPIWVTSYSSNVFGDLTNVVQNGSRPRTFTYDSLARLTISNNPEVGTITYAFSSDTNCSGSNSFPGLLVSKVDARSIRTCAQYDALNRQTALNYSNGDTSVTTTYDQSACLGLTSCDNIGHRTSMTDAAGSEVWVYQIDPTNHRDMHVDQRTTSGITKTSSYYLDLAGNVFKAVYPTTRTVTYNYDTANRPVLALDGSNGITYATGFQTSPGGTCITNVTCYTPQGSVYAVSIGQTSTFTGLNIIDSFNSRLQPNEFKASSSSGNAIEISYNFADPVTTKNAGHLYGVTNNLDTTRSQNFTYDQVNRIISALTTSTYATSPAHCWGEAYQYDATTNGAWGNLTQIIATTNSNYTGCSQESGFTATVDAYNHISSFGYDASGNATTEGSLTYGWNAESQLKSAAGVNYLYDGDGRRVSKSNGKLYWYGAGSEILAETDASGNTLNEYVFFAGKRVALLPAGSTAQIYVEDSLGTSRVVTNNTGGVCYDADFYPFGGERPYTNSCTQNNYKFEGKERDTETGDDDFGARYYSNRFGRWLSADWSAVPVAVPYANLTNPQTLNLYSMVVDDPESFADLDGHLENSPDQSGGAGQQGTSCPNGSGQPPCQNVQPQPAPDLLQQIIQTGADKKEQAIADQTRTPTEEDKKNALVQAGKEADVGVKAGLIVVGGEVAVTAVVAVGTSATAAEAAHATVQVARAGAREATAHLLTNSIGAQAARGAYEAIIPGSGRPSTPVEGVAYIVVKVLKNLSGF